MANDQWPWHIAILKMFRCTSRGATKRSIGDKFEVFKNLEIGPVGFPDVSDDQKLWNLAPNRLVWFSAHFGLICDQLGQWSSEIISSGAIWNHLALAVPRELFYMAFEETQVHQQAQSKCGGWTYAVSLSLYLSLSLSLFLSLMQCFDVAVKLFIIVMIRFRVI